MIITGTGFMDGNTLGINDIFIFYGNKLYFATV